AAGDGLIWRSTDDGRSWGEAYDSDPVWGCCGWVWGGEEGIFAVGRGGFLFSVDNGKTWGSTSLPKILPAPGGGCLRPFRAGGHLYVGGGKGVILHSADRGKTWEKQESGTSEYLFGIFAWKVAGHLEAYAVGENGIILRSKDGARFSTVRPPAAEPHKERLLAI